ncbi:hypothetical protein EDD21DRAFT_164811 [Dissophora ornata]|nr:hypothetical protein EDD21DRAFT_164811 [Dissophora ornata]
MLIRDLMIYKEMSSVIKIGDIGRFEKVIKWLTIIFQAGSASNYAAEFMHFDCRMRYAWSEDTKRAVLSSMFVNKSGTRNGWKPTDLYQEHNNRSIKYVYYSRQGDSSFDMLRERISTNIETFNNVKVRMEEQFQAPNNKRNHATMSAESDVDKILKVLSENGILGQDPESRARQNPTVKPARDLLADGIGRLHDKNRMQAFINKYGNGGQEVRDEPEGIDPEDSQEVRNEPEGINTEGNQEMWDGLEGIDTESNQEMWDEPEGTDTESNPEIWDEPEGIDTKENQEVA